MRRRVLAAALLVVGSSLLASAAWAEESIDHLTLLERMGSEVAAEVLDELQFPPGTTVHLVPESPHEANWLVARILERTLIARGCQVVSPDPASRPALAAPSDRPGDGSPAAGPAEDPSAGGASLFGGDAGDEDETSDSENADTDEQEESAEDDLDQEDEDVSDDEAGGESQVETAASGDSTEAPARLGPRARRQEAEQQAGASSPASAAPGFDVTLPSRGNVLVFRVVDCGVSYPWATRSWLVGPRRYGRLASVRLWASWLGQPGRQVQGVASAERVYLDAFPGWARPMLEGHAYPFPIEQPSTTSLRQVLEPVIVAGIISGLVYLFYQNQK